MLGIIGNARSGTRNRNDFQLNYLATRLPGRLPTAYPTSNDIAASLEYIRSLQGNRRTSVLRTGILSVRPYFWTLLSSLSFEKQNKQNDDCFFSRGENCYRKKEYARRTGRGNIKEYRNSQSNCINAQTLSFLLNRK